MKVTLISDTHGKHKRWSDLPGGDILIHSGDFMNGGYSKLEAISFFDWFDNIKNYKKKIFIAGNHDRILESDKNWSNDELSKYKTINYLEDSNIIIDDSDIHIWGSPWQPEFCNWAFNLPKGGEELIKKWSLIPERTDILITHGPPFGTLDTVLGKVEKLGCELLSNRVSEVVPKIHVFGHIHSGRGYYFNGQTHFFNASVLDENYYAAWGAWNFDWDPDTNIIKF